MPRKFVSISSDDRRSPRHLRRRCKSAEDPQRLNRLAALVASGEMPLPDDLNAADRHWLVMEVGRQRRTRLVRFIARAIAQDIHRSPAP